VELDTYVFAARLATRILLAMSAICLSVNIVGAYRMYRRFRNEHARSAPSAASR
jgi:hypothetical protein